MYIERRKRGDSFWILRFLDGEKEMFVKNISYAINEYIKEEYIEEFNKTIINVLNKVQYNEQYDEVDEQSAIISSSQIADILEYLLKLLYVTTESSQEQMGQYNELIKLTNNYKELTEEAIQSLKSLKAGTSI